MSTPGTDPPAPGWEQLWEQFDALVALPPGEREVALSGRVADPDLRRRLRTLLAGHAREGLLDSPPPRLGGVGPTAVDSGADLVGRCVAGYRILGVLGFGGSSTVYEAVQEAPRRRVALKVLRTGLFHAPSLERFQHESHVLARLQHPGIAQILEVGTLPGPAGRTPFLAMEYVEGEDPLVVAERWGRDLRRVLELVARLADAVQHAHGRGVVHRDLKPANVLVTAGGQPKVLDFGVARVLDDDFESTTLTGAGQLLGTLAWMSPEQVAGAPERVDARTDVHGLGLLAHCMLSGRPAFDLEGLDTLEALAAIAERDPPLLGMRDRRLAGDTEAIVARALAKSPEQRYATAAALAEDIRRSLSHQPISARRHGFVDSLRRLLRRHRAVAAGLAGGLALLVAAGVTIALALAGERAARRRLALLADLDTLQDLQGEPSALWPVGRSSLAEQRDWLARHDQLRQRLPSYEAALAAHRETALPLATPVAPGEGQRVASLHNRLQSLESRLEHNARPLARRFGRPDEPLMGVTSLQRTTETLEARVDAVRSQLARLAGQRSEFAYADPADAWLDDSLVALIDGCRRLEWPGEPNANHLGRSAVERLHELSRGWWERTVVEQQAAWQAVADYLAGAAGLARYGVFDLAPVEGLIPLGPDPGSGLLEFAHLASGFPARRDPATGQLERPQGTGIVLVLVPGGEVWIGAAGQRGPSGRPADPAARPDEGPCVRLQLTPFLISKFETTQRQWINLWAGSWGTYDAYNWVDGRQLDGDQPVETVTWRQCQRMADRLGLQFPTEAQWEHAARGGVDRPWWCGEAGLADHENLADQDWAARFGHPATRAEGWSDDSALPAAVGGRGPNPFGLHDMLGNVREWCRDLYGLHDAHARALGSGELLPGDGAFDRVIRGGSWAGTAREARASRRDARSPGSFTAADVGVRFALDLTTDLEAPRDVGR